MRATGESLKWIGQSIEVAFYKLFNLCFNDTTPNVKTFEKKNIVRSGI